MKKNQKSRINLCGKLDNFIWILALTITLGCNSQIGHRGISSSIEESVSNELFVADFKMTQNPYIINDTLILKVKKAWLEKQWKYGKNSDIIIIKNQYQLIVETNDSIKDEYGFNWTIGINASKYLRLASNSDFICDFDFLPDEKIKFKVQNGRKLKGDIDPKNIIGEIEFVRTSEVINK
ncbi:hypothetical protein [uncultured Aquimarina sp.]|uniref:hypothetical protein n=1 Tax=uncultured Aquimarina sp. TaxID=575652 RepID=UPI002609DD4C|nr:hypothetical protein [uncultured Aquimarina sp.]